ncbi:MAG: hypothetical protein HC857_08825 [Synechococcales cyanobacterium RU_4_20]|nr:hypothetical protein [Synechococcales cyanobacterium RU_4_20]
MLLHPRLRPFPPPRLRLAPSPSPAPEPTAPEPTAPPLPGDGDGLKAEYFDNQDFTGTRLVRTDATVNFDWKTGSPAPQLAPDSFSARWTGKLLAQHTETYTFSVAGDDGLRLWVDGKLLIDGWKTQSATEYRGRSPSRRMSSTTSA